VDGVYRDTAHLFSLFSAVNHEFGGNHPVADVSRNGALRDAQPGRILEGTARTKVDRYRARYAAIKYAFLPRVISTSGRREAPR